MKNYVIFGDSAFAERIYKYIKQEGVDNVLCFTNEGDYINRERIAELNVVPFEKLSELYDNKAFEILICIGYANMNKLRKKIYCLCKNAGYKIGTWISSTVISYTKDIDEGNIIMPGVLIGPSTKIGKCNIIAARTTISHDNIIEDFNFISTNVIFGGGAVVNKNCFIGLNCTIKNSITISDYTIIGAASNVLRSTEENCVYVGNPAKKLEGKESLNTKI